MLTEAMTLFAADEAAALRPATRQVAVETRGLRKTYFGKVSVPVLHGVAFIMITHDERLAEAADHVLLIEDGCLREPGRKEIYANRMPFDISPSRL